MIGVNATRQKVMMQMRAMHPTTANTAACFVPRMTKRKSWVSSSSTANRYFLSGCFFVSLFFSDILIDYICRMNRIIGIDYGKKRTGLAVSDPLGMFASPLDTVPPAKIIEYLENYAAREGISLFVVGYPMNLDNTPSEAARYVDEFLARLRKHFPDIPVVLEDERFTSVLAHRAMIDGGMKKMDRRDKSVVDRISAAIILQSYLDRKN